jgi:2-succinyl-6-hydroxy-2,4-cyclohexadiene-1-carboxylate synthase
MGDSSDWEPVVSYLCPKYYCVAVDLPGHGRSLGSGGRNVTDFYSLTGAADGVVEVMGHQGIVPALVVGYSMGGRVALYLATRYAGTCSKLVIESATPGIEDRGERQNRLKLDRMRAQELQARGLPDFLRRWYRQPIFDSIAESPSRLEMMVRKRSGNDPAQLARALVGMSVGGQRPLWKALSELDVPVLLLAGRRDPKYVEIIQAMAAALPRSTTEIVPPAAHAVPIDDPIGVARRIDQFISNHENCPS